MRESGDAVIFPDTTIKSIRYTCDSLGMHKVNLWVTDQITGLQDYCTTTITIQDNNKVCGNRPTLNANLAGLIVTPFDQPVSEVTLKVDGPQGILQKNLMEVLNLRISGLEMIIE